MSSPIKTVKLITGETTFIEESQMGGTGDMTKTVYDTDNDGVVDNSEKLEGSTKTEVQNHAPQTHTLTSHSTRAHSELSGIGENDHHTKFTITEHDLTARHVLGTVVPHDTLASLTAKSHTSLTDIGSNTHAQIDTHIAADKGYTISVQALTSSPTDGQTVYFGMLPKVPVTVAATSKIYIRKAGTIKIAEIYCYSGTAGTAEAWSLYIRKNNSADTLIATLSVSASERVFSNTGLNIAVVVGDYIEIKGIQPSWATNPLTTIYGGYVYIE